MKSLKPAVLMIALSFWVACGGSPPLAELDAAADALAGAELARDCAREEYRAAERLLAEAREASAAGDYDRARTLALSAQEQAQRARLQAQANADDCEALRGDAEEPDYDMELQDIDTNYALTPVYFTYDAASLDVRARQTLQAHATFFNGNNFRIIVEGHCDYNGTDQYNLALGEARARTVAQHLVTLGVDPTRIRTISYGEFRPASATDTALNRRAEFRIQR